MAKKTDTTKPAAPAAVVPPAKRATKAAPKKLVAKAKLPAVKAAKPAAKTTKKAPAAKAVKAVKPAKPGYTHDDVALRAYFIAEKRNSQGLPGSEHGDWVEAERQLMAESAKPKKAKVA